MADPPEDLISQSLKRLLGGLSEPTDQPRPARALPQLPLGGGAEARPVEQPDNANSAPGADQAATGDPQAAQELDRVIQTPEGPVWIQGTAVMCACPDCSAPISIRTWLMIADCWRCENSVELSYEQQLAVERLARQIQPDMAPLDATPTSASPPRRPATDADVRLHAELDAPQRTHLIDVLRRTVSMMPAWLISFLLHLVLLLILALILLEPSEMLPTITISTAVGPKDVEGGVEFSADPLDPLEFDSLRPPDWRQIERELRDVKLNADQDARELRLDLDPVATPPDLELVKEAVTNRSGPSHTLAIRDPRLRNELVLREGGTTLSEAAVSRGLKWLASVQNHDGSWSLADYRDHDDPSNRGDSAATSLALLPFLGAGQTHEYGAYKDTVTRGLKWLMDHQESNGDLRYGIKTDAGMYAHGQASIVLVEALAMTGDERFRESAQNAIRFIERGQHRDGGWRYQPGQAGDTSVLGWQLMALQSARVSNTGLAVEDATLKLADYYLDLAGRSYNTRSLRNVPSGALYRYLPSDGRPKASMTAEAILCRMYLGWRRDDPRMMYAVRWLLTNALPERSDMNMYYWYYATQVMHHYGGKEWEVWNNHLRDLLIVEQQRGGRYPGSWNPGDFEYGRSGGRIYVTALAVCTLEVYYRHLPLFKQIDLD